MAYPRISDRVRTCYDWTYFRCLKIGERFRFASEVDYPYGMKQGVCERVTTRKYKYADEKSENQVGSVHAVVLRLNEDGSLRGVGEYSPSLRD